LAVPPPAALAHRPEFSLTISYQAEVLMPDSSLAKLMKCRFQPALSWSTIRVWVPAARVTLAVTVVQSCQPPVSGAFTSPDRFVPDVLAICRASVTPSGEARRRLTV
jgi:hypothetical protein